MTGMRRAPLSCFLCCVACQPEWICQFLAFPTECDWNVICFQVECLGHGFISDFLSDLVSTQSAFSHNATRRRSLKIKNSKVSLDNESRHTCRRYFSYTAMLSWFANLSQIRSIFPTHQINQRALKRYILKTLHEIRHSNFPLSWRRSVCREVEADEAVQVALSTSALSQCFKGKGRWKQLIWAVW